MEVVYAFFMIMFCGAVFGIPIYIGWSKRQRALTNSPVLALNSGDSWYRHAQKMARQLESLLADDMISCTISDQRKAAIRKELDAFWNDNEED